MEKTAEQLLNDRISDIAGARRHTKVASMVESHAEPTHEEVITKMASMELGELMENPHFVRGFESRVAARMPELDAAFDNLISVL